MRNKIDKLIYSLLIVEHRKTVMANNTTAGRSKGPE